MQPPRRRSRARLPHAPIELAHPLRARRAAIDEAALLAELPAECAVPVFQTYRLLIDWTRGSAGAGMAAVGAAAQVLEERVLRGAWADEVLWGATAVIAGELRRRGEADPEAIADACLVLVDRAYEHGHRKSALLFAEAAAEAWPENARLAWLAGRLHRNAPNYREAELWLKRARRIAVWTRDRYTQGMTLTSLGTLATSCGDYPEAKRWLTIAWRVSRRYRVQELRALILHDLFTLSVLTNDVQQAEEFARLAFKAYGAEHPSLVPLAMDIAYFWIQQGYFGRSLPVLTALLGHSRSAQFRLRVLACLARAAGALGNVDQFRKAWNEAFTIVESAGTEALKAAAALELGIGASNLGFWKEAGYAIEIALATAAEVGEGDVIEKGEAALERVRRAEAADSLRRPTAGPRSMQPGDVFARNLVSSLSSE
jgi:tetratricopeptide (TPR) repeat protein